MFYSSKIYNYKCILIVTISYDVDYWKYNFCDNFKDMKKFIT